MSVAKKRGAVIVVITVIGFKSNDSDNDYDSFPYIAIIPV